MYGEGGGEEEQKGEARESTSPSPSPSSSEHSDLSDDEVPGTHAEVGQPAPVKKSVSVGIQSF